MKEIITKGLPGFQPITSRIAKYCCKEDVLVVLKIPMSMASPLLMKRSVHSVQTMQQFEAAADLESVVHALLFSSDTRIKLKMPKLCLEMTICMAVEQLFIYFTEPPAPKLQEVKFI